MIEFYTKQYRYGVVEPATILLTALPSPPPPFVRFDSRVFVLFVSVTRLFEYFKITIPRGFSKFVVTAGK